MTEYDYISSDEEDNLSLNGKAIEEDGRWDIVTDWVAHFLSHEQFCPYCGCRLRFASHSEEIDVDEGYMEEVKVTECPRCAYWHCYWDYDEGFISSGYPSVRWACQISKLAVYDESLPEGFYIELAQQLRINPRRWYSMSPTDLEKLVAEI